MRAAVVLLPVAVLAAAGACSKSMPDLVPSMIPEPPPAEVQSIIFVFGDAGYADEQHDPVLGVLRADVERWSAALARDSAVMVLFAGDIIYPAGMHAADDPQFAADSAVAQSQVNIVAGPNARRHGTIGYFMAGNHDWGNATNHTGVRRLQNLEEFLNRRRLGGVHVRLQPEAGEPGPAVIDFGSTRLLMFDTAWWLLAKDEYLKLRSRQQTRDAIRSSGQRNLIIAAHHPFVSASSHGGLVPFWRSIGLRYILARTGALLQDLNSIAYRELLGMLLDAFEEKAPLVFAAGHDHTLQIIEGRADRDPRFNLVVGSGSKSSPVGHAEGTRFRSPAPGYMRIITHRNGRVDLFVVAAPDEDHLHCSSTDGELATCMRDKAAAFHVVYGQRIK